MHVDVSQCHRLLFPYFLFLSLLRIINHELTPVLSRSFSLVLFYAHKSILFHALLKILLFQSLCPYSLFFATGLVSGK